MTTLTPPKTDEPMALTRYANCNYRNSAIWFGYILFTQKVELSSKSGEFPPEIPNRFWIIPTFVGGNLDFRITEHDPSDITAPITDQEAWTVFNASINSTFGLSLVLKHRTGILLQLTSTSKAKRAQEATISQHEWLSGDWVGGRHRQHKHGHWTFTLLRDLPSDGSRLFFWNFLIQPPNEKPFTVTFPFSLLGALNSLELRQVGESFPAGWRAQQIEFPPRGLEFNIVNEKKKEQYSLKMGLFSGGLGRIVCQGEMVIRETPENGAPHQETIKPLESLKTCIVEKQENSDPLPPALDGTQPAADGTWTGTSSGP
jgi:hypothetical protein